MRNRTAQYHLPSITFKQAILVLIVLLTSSLLLPMVAQEVDIDEIEDNIKNTFGLEKLEGLNILTLHYQEQNSRKALRYGRQAVALGNNIANSIDSEAGSQQIDSIEAGTEAGRQ